MNDEFEKLESLWKQQNSGGKDTLEPYNPNYKFKNALSHLRRSLVFESLFAFALLVFLGQQFYLRAPNEQSQYAAIQMIILLLPILAFYYHGILKTRSVLRPDQPIRRAIQEQIIFWEQALRIYFWGGAAFLPAFLLSFFWYTESAGIPTLLRVLSKTQIGLLGGLAAISLAAAFLVKGLVWLSYGRHLAHLRDILRELEEGTSTD